MELSDIAQNVVTLPSECVPPEAHLSERTMQQKTIRTAVRHWLRCCLMLLAEALVCGLPLEGELLKHAAWAQELKARYTFTPENADGILKKEVGQVFALVLEHAGVYKRTPEGTQAFLRFIRHVNGMD